MSRQRFRGLRYAGRGVVLMFAALFALCAGLQSLVGFVQGPAVFVVATGLATLTAVPFTLAVVWLDRNEQEPWWLMTTAFLWGALVATAISGVFNTAFFGVATLAIGNELISNQLAASFSAPFIEELTKGAAVGIIYVLFKDHFDNVLDGILYGALVGLGFAWLENIDYYVMAAADGGIVAMLELTWIRGVLNGVGSHAAYTGLTGLGFGLFRVMRSGLARWLVVPFFLGTGMFVHFMWNTFAIIFIIPFFWSNTGQLLISLPLAVLVLEMPFVLLLLGIVLLVWRHEHTIIRDYLAGEPADVATGADVAALVPARRRSWTSLETLINGGPVRWWRRRSLDRTLIRLAFVKWHHEKDAEIDWHPDRDADVLGLRERVRRLRAGLA